MEKDAVVSLPWNHDTPPCCSVTHLSSRSRETHEANVAATENDLLFSQPGRGGLGRTWRPQDAGPLWLVWLAWLLSLRSGWWAPGPIWGSSQHTWMSTQAKGNVSYLQVYQRYNKSTFIPEQGSFFKSQVSWAEGHAVLVKHQRLRENQQIRNYNGTGGSASGRNA